MPRSLGWIVPGLLVAATGVGAGDLATAGFTGSQVGLSCLWAVVVGSLFKYVLSEGIARYQLATGETLLEGLVARYPRLVPATFLPFLVFWSYFVGAALMSACGVTFHALWPVFDDPARAKLVFGAAHSVAGLLLVRAGGFKLFERTMMVFTGAMFATVAATAARMWPGTGVVLRAALVPDPATLSEANLPWTVALIGGVGGTVTLLCYGYWMREKGRATPAEIGLTRADLGIGYLVTMLFGVFLVVLGAGVRVEGSGATLIVDLADRLEGPMGRVGRWTFLVGAWGAVFSSLLGVWQSVPYLFADVWGRARGGGPSEGAYGGYMLFLTFVPMPGLIVSFKEVQKLYALVGASFLPLLALALLVAGGDRHRLGSLASGPWSRGALVGTLVFFVWLLWRRAAGAG